MQETASDVPCETLLAVCNRISPTAMGEVVAQRLPSFYRAAFRFLGNSADAEDAVQEALLSAYKHLDEFRGESQLSTWVTSIVANCARMQLRRRPRHLQISLDEPLRDNQEYALSERLADFRPNPEDECREAELKARLRALSNRLPPALRRTFQLRELQDLSIHEVASILNLAEGTVKAQLSRARAKLTRSMRRALDPRPRRSVRRSGNEARNGGLTAANTVSVRE
jgi:RNA polymerase sigma-70 factor (ECF subfamily)